ncbi:hypothetical protein [Gottfriedia acidiceleris]|uniref:hypothetical protein n=1 Tax=Gottfriedia acidiceleris TaxID=371036 RepID=UPI0013EBAD00|nr:hypothetical protein [Gottfriedia acidiceleris]
MAKGKLSVTIDVKNMDSVKQTFEIMADVLKDERIPVEIRKEYSQKIDEVIKEYEE